MWVYSHMSFSIWSVCAWLCAGKMLYTNGLFTFVAAVGAQRIILTIPSPLSPIVVWLLCVFVSMCSIFVSRLPDSPQTAADRHKRHTHTDWITNGPCWHTGRDVDKLCFRLNAQPNRKPQLHLSLSVWLQQRWSAVYSLRRELQGDGVRQQGCDTVGLDLHATLWISLYAWTIAEGHKEISNRILWLYLNLSFRRVLHVAFGANIFFRCILFHHIFDTIYSTLRTKAIK